MRNLRRLSTALVALAFIALAGSARPETANLPSWVPPQYAKFIVRYVDERPPWQRALSYLNVSVGDTGRSFALVAGVSKYPQMGGRAGDLWPAKLDVEKMTAYLSGAPESFNEIVVLLDGDMTPENLRYFLTQYFPRRLADNPRSRFLFAYSGHGMTDDKGRGYILTNQATSLTDWYDGISLAELRAEFQAVVDRGHQVLALINSCYGVEFHRMSFAFGGTNDVPLPTREGAHAITAGGSGELTWHDDSFGEGDGPKGSIFFEAVFAALDGRADKLPTDGIVTVGELETYLRTTVSRFTEEKQNPTASDLVSTTSPGGFFFLDRNRQIEEGNATPLTGEWWGGLAFGAAPDAAAASPVAPLPDFDSLATPADVAGSNSALNGAANAATPLNQPAPPSKMLPSDEVVAAVPSKMAPSLDALTGRWSGEAAEPGGAPFPLEIEITAGCAMEKACGTIAVPDIPCRGKITMIDSREEGYEFDVSDFDASSDKSVCQPGAGEVFKPLPDGTLSYTATYSGATGILKRIE